MNLAKKRILASKALKIGLNRILFNSTRLQEINEAITKQDMRDLYASGAMTIIEVTGRAKVEHRKTRRKAGSIKKKVKDSKGEYMIITRKLRNIVAFLLEKKIISKENFLVLRKEIKSRSLRSKAQLKERVAGFKAK
jgi:large subunit ribosomal protein L19e